MHIAFRRGGPCLSSGEALKPLVNVMHVDFPYAEPLQCARLRKGGGSAATVAPGPRMICAAQTAPVRGHANRSRPLRSRAQRRDAPLGDVNVKPVQRQRSPHLSGSGAAQAAVRLSHHGRRATHGSHSRSPACRGAPPRAAPPTAATSRRPCQSVAIVVFSSSGMHLDLPRRIARSPGALRPADTGLPESLPHIRR